MPMEFYSKGKVRMILPLAPKKNQQDEQPVPEFHWFPPYATEKTKRLRCTHTTGDKSDQWFFPQGVLLRQFDVQNTEK
jgi:hypothetical protein